jgi:segregation and condensation protein B
MIEELENEKIGIIEGMFFLAGDEGLSLKEIRTVLEDGEANTRLYIERYKELLEKDSQRGLQLVFLAGKYKLTTKPVYKPFYERMIQEKESVLSQAALETLAIIAYKQPVTRVQIEEIRGVASDAIVRRLQARALIKEVGRQDSPGKPILYGVTDIFMDAFNLATLEELPPLEEILEDPQENMSIFDFKYQETENVDI